MDVYNQPTSVGVYILTHNRLSTLRRTINSVVNQTFKDMTIIVSDNSDNDETENAMQEYIIKYNNLFYIHHKDANSSDAHFDKLLTNNEYEYFILFHDDDEMLPEMVEELYNALCGSPNASAAAPYYLKNVTGHVQKSNFKDAGKAILSAKDLAYKYINHGVPAFPSYMYRASLIKGVKMLITEGGKYRDASFILKVADRGGICVVHKYLMMYYIYAGQDSQKHDYLQYLGLIKFLRKYVDTDKDITPSRIFNIYNTLCADKSKIIFKKKALLLFFRYSTLNCFPKYTLRLLKLYKK